MKTINKYTTKLLIQKIIAKKNQELINSLYVIFSKGLFPFSMHVNLLAKTKRTLCYGIQIAKC